MDNKSVESYGLEKLHKILLEVLGEFDKICRENNICYSLDSGTLLGAERNHKIIPWDDDIDVSMSRSEYKKFCDILTTTQTELQIDDGCLWVPRLVKKKNNELVWIDIFVWDYISGRKSEKFLKLSLLRAMQGMLKPVVEYKEHNFFNKVLLFFTHMIGKVFSFNFKLKLYHFLQEKCFLGKKEYIHRSNGTFKGISYIFDSNYMSEYMDIELEGKMYMVTKRYHEDLVKCYGKDYMTPPPVEQRKLQHERLRSALR